MSLLLEGMKYHNTFSHGKELRCKRHKMEHSPFGFKGHPFMLGIFCSRTYHFHISVAQSPV